MARSRSATIRGLAQRRSPQAPGRVSFGEGGSQAIYPWSMAGPVTERESAPHPALRATRTFTGARITLTEPGSVSTTGVLRADGTDVASWIIPADTSSWFSPFGSSVTVAAGSVMTVEVTDPGSGAEGITLELA